MRIAFDATVLHPRKSGVGYYCEELLRALTAQDHETEFIVFSHRRIAVEFRHNGNVRVHTARRFPIRALYLHGLLPGVLDAVRPTLTHYTNFLAPIADDRPYVVSVHDMSLERLRHCHPLAKRLYTRNMTPWSARRARLVLTNSEFSKWDIVRFLGIPEERIRVTPLAASPEFRVMGVGESQPVLEKYRLHQKAFVLYVGNIEPRKNLERLVEAFAKLGRKDLDLIMVGNAAFQGERVRRRARQLNLDGSVRFLGYVPRNDLAALYNRAAVFVYPSLLEGFGLPVLESMACGTPVITSNSSSLHEMAGGAALEIDPGSVPAIADAIAAVLDDRDLRVRLLEKGLERAKAFSWERTALLTRQAYFEAADAAARPSARPPARRPVLPSACPSVGSSAFDVQAAIRKTLDYAAMFQYPLQPDEIRERLFDVAVDAATFSGVLDAMPLPRTAGYVCGTSELVELRRKREAVTETAVSSLRPALKTLVNTPFVRMLAFSGATAHRNMVAADDLDIFAVVEDGKLWAVLLWITVWAKLKGLRRRICVNYVLSDRALPLFQIDPFTAQQIASLKPFFGKCVYDRFVELNPFVRRYFPNFDPARSRGEQTEMAAGRLKRFFEAVLRFGPVQFIERLSRFILGVYLRRKASRAAASGDTDVLLERNRIKLHLQSHKERVLRNFES